MASRDPSLPLVLQCAVDAGDMTRVDELLRCSVDVNAFDDEGCSVLAFCRDAGMARHLLDAGADPNAAPEGEAPRALYWACASGRLEVVRVLIEARASMQAELRGWGEDSDWESSLHAAVGTHDYALVEFLLASGATCLLNTFDYVGRTPLIVAVEAGLDKMVRLLIDHGADLNARDERRNGDLAITAAAKAQGIDMVKLLLAAGAKLLVRGELPCMALLAARRREDQLRDSVLALITEQLRSELGNRT